MASASTSIVSSEAGYDPKTDPKRKAKSNDPGWKYGYWPEIGNRDKVMCILCNAPSTGGIKRLKEHLAGGYSDVIMCPNTTTEIRKEMGDYLKKNKRSRSIFLGDDDEGGGQDVKIVAYGIGSQDSTVKPSSRTAAKRRNAAFSFKAKANAKETKSVTVYKHHPPVLEDEVWRLEKIGKEGAFHKRLNRERIVCVKDFLTLLRLDAPRLRKILGSGMSTKMWEVTVEHAKTCILTDKVHFYYPDNLSKTAVVFNVVGEVRGLISEKFVSVDDLTEKEKAEAHAAVKQAYENWKNVMTCDNKTLLESPSQLFNLRSPSLHENGYIQFPTQVATDGFGLSHSDIPSADIFSTEPLSALDPCALETAESNENRFQWELPPLGGHVPPQEFQAFDKFSNSLVYEECTGHPSFSEDYYRCADPTVSFDTQDLGAAVEGFIVTISKPRGYRGWRTLSFVVGWIFYTKRIYYTKKILAVVSTQERAKRLKLVGLRINEDTESCELIDAPTTPTTIQDSDLIEAVVVNSNMVAQDLTVATETTVLEIDESTPSDQMVRDLILDQPVKNISSGLQLEDVGGLISPTGLGPMKLVEQKKKKASATDFASACVKLKTKKTTRSSGIPIDSDQSTPQEKTPEEKVKPAPEQVAVLVPAQELVVAPTPHAEVVVLAPPAEVVVLRESQQAPTPAESSRQVVFSHRFRISEDEHLNEAWRKISNRQAKTSSDSIFAEYNNMAIQHMVENLAVIGGLTQRIKLLEKKNSELENLEKLKEEVMAKEAIITKLKEECQNKDWLIEYLTTRPKEVLEIIEKKSEEDEPARAEEIDQRFVDTDLSYNSTDPSPAGNFPEWDDGLAGTDATAGGEGTDYGGQGEGGVLFDSWDE